MYREYRQEYIGKVYQPPALLIGAAEPRALMPMTTSTEKRMLIVEI